MVFLSNINKRLIDLPLPKNIVDYGGQDMPPNAFAIVQQCDRALC